MRTTNTITTLVLALALALSFGCESEVQLVDNSGDSPADNAKPGDDDETGDDQHADIEEPEGTVEAGPFTGSWRVATTDSDAPAVYIDLLHAQGEADLSGDFKMGPAVAERLDGQTGPIISGTASDGALTVKFNPTTDPEEVYTLSASGDEPMTGTITAKKNVELSMEVAVTTLPTD